MNTWKMGVILLFCAILTACGGGSGGSGGTLGGGTGGGTGGGGTATNTAPVAEAGVNQSVNIGQTVNLNAGGSTDADGDSLTYAWSISSAPNGSSASLTSVTSASTNITLDVAGTYVIALVVNDGAVNSAIDTMTINVVANQAPVANAGADLNGEVGLQTVIDGSASSDPENNTLIYTWSIIQQPAGSAATLIASAAPQTGLTPDIAGQYVLQLIVNDGVNISLADSVTITVRAANVAPVAAASLSSNAVNLGETITLDASASTDADSFPFATLEYIWTLTSAPDGSAVEITNPTQAIASFRPDIAGDYTFGLSVFDGRVQSNELTFTASATSVNNAPVADAGSAQTGVSGAAITLDATGSADSDGDSLTYSWSVNSQPAGANVQLSDTAVASPSVTFNETGDYVFTVTVSDGQLTNSDNVTVTITASNTAPVAVAGPDQSIALGTSATLSAVNSSDADGDLITYLWSIESQPSTSTISLDSVDTVTIAVTPDVAGDYQFGLVVNDGSDDSPMSIVSVVVNAQNAAPVADAGVNQGVLTGTTVTLDASLSRDADNDSLNYLWSFSAIPAASSATLSSTSTVTTGFTADVAGQYIAQVTVTDTDGLTDSDTVVIVVDNNNVPPVANAGPDQNVRIGASVVLDASDSVDTDGDTLTYQWQLASVPNGSNTAVNQANQAQASFLADAGGQFVLTLTVSDGVNPAVTDNMIVNVSTTNAVPIANITAPAAGFTRQVIQLDANASTDADGDTLTYQWTLSASPENSNAALSSADQPIVGFVADVVGNYEVSLIVNDGLTDSVVDTQTISVSPHIVLERLNTASSTPSFIDVEFPYDRVSINLSWPGSQTETFYTLDTFRITGMDQNYTISTIQSGTTDVNFLPSLHIPAGALEDFEPTTETIRAITGTTVPLVQGESQEFVLISPLTGGSIVDVTIRFRIEETGEIFNAVYRYSTVF